MAIELITYANKTVTPMNDAIVNDAEMGASGILHGCEPSYNGNTITISSGYGLIKGRLFRVTTTQLSVELENTTTSGWVQVRLSVADSSNPIRLETTTTGSEADTGDDDANYNFSYYTFKIAKFIASSSSITGIEACGKKLPVLHPTIYARVGDLGLTSPVSVADVYNAMPLNSIAYIPSNELTSASIPSTEGGVLEIIKLDYTGSSYTGEKYGKSITFKQGLGGYDARMYFNYSGNVATPDLIWHTVAKEEDVFYKAGEEDTLVCQGGGFITASNTSIRFFVNYSKIKKSATGVTFVQGTLIARENGRYIAGDTAGSFALDSGNTTITVKNNGLMVNVTESNGFTGATNNSPVAIYAQVVVRFT